MTRVDEPEPPAPVAADEPELRQAAAAESEPPGGRPPPIVSCSAPGAVAPGGAGVGLTLRGVKARVYPVGRLDYASEGLLLLTNDGEFAKRITSASSHVTKTYLVKTNGPLSTEQEEKFREGVPLGGKKTAPAGPTSG